MQLVTLGAVGLVSALAVWWASVVLEDSSDRLCGHHQVPALVQGP